LCRRFERLQTRCANAVSTLGEVVKRHENIHVYPAPIVNEGRIYRQTLSVALSGLFSRVIICGIAVDGLPREEYLTSGRRIDRVGTVVRRRRPTVLGRIHEQVSWSMAVWKRYSRSDICVVNAHSVAVLPVCYLLSRRLRAKLIYDTHELETETAVSFGLQGRIFKMIERLIIGRCDAVFVVNESIADWYRRRYGGIEPVVIRNIPTSFAVRRTIDVRHSLSVPADKRLFIHVGNIVAGRNVQAILDTFASPAVDDHVVFLGAGQLEKLVLEYSASHPNIHMLPPVPPEDVVSHVAACDAALCLIQSSCLSYRLSLPNKALEYTVAGVPFFFTDLPEITRLLGPGFRSWMIVDPARDLEEAVAGLSADAIEQATAELGSVRLPTWDEESEAMMVTYLDLVGRLGTTL
jgi:glycosyltransferase involved in cell wall biosynthesis